MSIESPNVPPRRTAACVALLVVIVAVTFARLVASDFTFWDDQDTIHQNPLLNPPTLATLRYYWTTMPQGLYVPVTYTIWAAIARVAYVGVPDEFGISLNPTFFHLASIACHAGTTSLAFFVLRRLFNANRPALLGAILFAVHPVQVETVGWVSGGKDLFCWLGVMAIVLLYVRRVQAIQADGRRLWASWEMPVAALLLALAILSKPTALVTPAALLAIDGFALRRRWARSLIELAPFCVIAVGGMIVARIAQTVLADMHVPLVRRPLIVGDALAFYLAKLVWPVHLSADYGRRPAVALADPLIGFRWIVPALVAVALISVRRRAPMLTLAGAIFVIGIAPVSGIAMFQMQRISTVTDHYLYFSMLGPAIALAWLMARWRGHVATTLALALLAALAGRAFAQTAAWRDAFALFEATIRENPRSIAARVNLIVCYLDKLKPEPEVAERYADEAYAINPDDFNVAWNYGVAKEAVHDFEASQRGFERAWQAAVREGAPPAFLRKTARTVAEALRDTPRYADAIRWTERQLAVDPGDVRTREALAELRRRQAATRPAATAAPAPAPASAPSR